MSGKGAARLREEATTVALPDACRAEAFALCVGAPVRALRIAAALILLIVSTLLPSKASSQTPATLAILSVDDSDFPRVTAVVAVLAGGRPVLSVGAGDVTVTESGAPAQVLAVTPAADGAVPVGAVIVLDRSGSMEAPIAPGQGRRIDVARQAAKALIGALGDYDQAAVLSFSNSVGAHQSLTADRTAALAAVDRIPAPLGTTALYDGLIGALEEAHRSGLARSAVVLLSDGKDEGAAGQAGSRASQQEVIDRANQYGVPLLVIGAGVDAETDAILRHLANATAGTYRNAQNSAAVQQAFLDAAQALRTQYAVSFRSNAPADSRAYPFEIKVNAPGGAASAGATLQTRPVPPALSLKVRGDRADATPFEDEDVLDLSAPRSIEFTAEAQGGTPQIRFRFGRQEWLTLRAPPYDAQTLAPAQLPPGDYPVIIEAADAAGNLTTRTLTVRVHAVPPIVQPPFAPGSTLSGTQAIRPELESRQAPIREVTYQLDGRTPVTVTTPPFDYALSTEGLSRGGHTLRMTVVDTNGQRSTQELPFQLAGTTFNPGLLIVFGGAALAMILGVGFLITRRRQPLAAASATAGRAGAATGVAPAGNSAPAATELSVALLSVEGDDWPGGVVQPVPTTGLVIGRATDCGLVLDNPRVSRHHARIASTDGTLQLEDLGSRAGVICDGVPIPPHGRAPLHDGSEVRLGPYRMILSVNDHD
jgi:hypothetical protein